MANFDEDKNNENLLEQESETNNKPDDNLEDNNNDDNNNDNNEQEKDNRSLGEKIGDGVEGFFDGVQEVFYGANPDYTHDIPATIEKPSGPRKVIKVQTRRNINKRIFKTKGFKIALVLFSIGLVIAILTQIIGALMVSG